MLVESVLVASRVSVAVLLHVSDKEEVLLAERVVVLVNVAEVDAEGIR